MYQLRDAVLRPSVAEVGTTTYDIAKMLSLDCFAATTSRVQGLPRHWHGSSRRRGHRQQRVNQRLLLSFCFFLPQLGAIGVLSVERRLDERSFDLGTRLLKSVIGSWAVTAVLFRHSALGFVCFLPVRGFVFHEVALAGKGGRRDRGC